MSGLAALQRDFLARVLGEAARGEPAGLDIYRSSIGARLEESLAAAYPVVARLVGAAFFGEAARRFARASPSRSGDLAEFGAGFAAFLAAYAHAAPLPYLADVARLEWALHESQRAAHAPPFDFAALAAVDPARHGELRLRLHPSVRLVASPWAVLDIWRANRDGADGVADPDAGAQRVMLGLGASQPVMRTADDGEWRLLEGLARGALLGELCDGMGEAPEGLVEAALARLAAEGVIAGFALGPESC